jgi:branched-chain amino acid transport system permease protein
MADFLTPAPAFTLQRSTRLSGASAWLALPLLLALLTLPWWGSSSAMRLMIEVICTLVLAQMWNLLAGYGGLISVGQQAYVGLGGYALFALAQHGGVSPFLAVPLAGLLVSLVALPTARLVFRLRGGYFAIGTWVVAEVFRIAVSNISAVGGGSGQSLTVMARVARDTREVATYGLAVLLLIACFGAMVWLLRSRHGLALTALRDSEAAAESQGVAVMALKVRIYWLSALGSALVGALYYLNALRISPTAAFDLNWLIAAIFIVVIGGIGTLEGPIVGAVVYFALREGLADHGSLYWLVLGVVAIGVMLTSPKGL